MSLSQRNLASIQKAGQATHSASEAIAATVRAQAQSMVTSVASQPFGTESELAITRFKMLARLSQGLTSVEVQLRELFAVAEELASPVSDVVIALPFVAKHAESNSAAIDAVVKPAKATKTAKKKLKSKRMGRPASVSGDLTANDTKLLNYLQGVLKVDEWTRSTGGAMAAGAGLPLGSVGLSIKKVIASGAVKAGARGTYQLGTAPVAAIAAAGPKSAKIKKAKSTRTKKAKPAVQSVNATADAETSAA
jgi:hypothetical protein